MEISLEKIQKTTKDISLNFCCCICGKKLDESKTYNYVHLLTNGNITTEEESEISQGSFPIGNECKKKVPKNFIF